MLVIIDVNMQHNIQVIKYGGQSTYTFQLGQGFMSSHSPRLDEKIYKWLAVPDLSRNYNDARENHQEHTGSWFIDGTLFAEWKVKADISIWIHGIRKFSSELCMVRLSAESINAAGSGKTILW
jgi:hypothetical protein